MADITKIIRSIFRAETDQLTRAVRGIRSATESASSGLDKLNQRLDKLRNLAAGGALTYGLGRMVAGLVRVNATAETTKLGIATLVQSTERFVGGNMKFADALRTSSELMAKLRKEAVDTPGTLEQVSEAFQTVYMRARGAGLSQDEIVKFAGNIATQDAMMGGRGVVARDVEQLLRGETGDVATPQLAMIKKQVAAAVQEGRMAEAAKQIVNALDLDPEARKAAGESFEGQLSSAKDQLLQIAEIVGKPLFMELNKGLKDMLAWLTRNKDQVEKIAKTVGGVLVDAFKLIVSVLGSIADAIQWLADSPMAAFIASIGAAYAAFTLLAAHPIFAAVAGLAAILHLGPGIVEPFVNPELARAKMFGVKDQAELDALKAKTAANDSNLATLQDIQGLGYNPAEHVSMSDAQLEAAAKQAQAIQSIYGVGDFPTNQMALAIMKGKGAPPEELNAVAAVAWERSQRDADAAYMASWIGLKDVDPETARLSMERGMRLRHEFGYGQDVKSTSAYQQREAELTYLLFDQPAFSGKAPEIQKAEFKVDARGARVTNQIRLTTNDPARLAAVSLTQGFIGVAARPLSGRMGLGSVPLATGR